MRMKSERGRAVHREGGSSATARKVERLRCAMAAAAGTGRNEGLPPASRRLRRDASGRPPVKPRSQIRDAILEQLDRRDLTRYQLWKSARKHCPTLPESAVYEFFRGQRRIGLEYIEALLHATGLSVQPMEAVA